MNNFLKSPTFTEMLLPNENKELNVHPEISIVVPSLNEEITIGEFVDWCWEGLRLAGVNGEIIIVDSSTDNTPNIALHKGARVLRTPKNGLGQAYLDAIPHIRGNFIIMGDCDLTYDFRMVKDFIDSYKAGNDYVMGSRFKGSIELGSMPPLHQYFGTPLTTWILNKIYGSNYSDIHCGMRGLTKDAFIRINLTSKDWEYASEMVLKASRLKLKIDEVPVSFYKDRDGRLSHHRRAGFLSPWIAGWINLKVMLIYSPETFFLRPGIFIFIIGIVLISVSAPNKYTIGSIGLSTHTMLLGMIMTILGQSLFSTAILGRSMHGLYKVLEDNKFLNYNKYNLRMFIAIISFIIGFIMLVDFIFEYISNNYIVYENSHKLIIGLTFIITGIQAFAYTLLMELSFRLK